MTSVPRHSCALTVTNKGNSWSSRPRLLGTESLAIDWECTHSTSATPNTAKIRIHNPSQATQAAITDTVRRVVDFTPGQLRELAAAGASTAPAEVVTTNAGIAHVKLEVGETGHGTWLWYTGSSSSIDKEGDAIVLQCADFADQVGAGHVLPPRSFATGTPIVDVVQTHIHAMGLSVDPATLEREMYAQYAKLGKVRVGATKLLSPLTTAGPAVEWIRKLFTALKLTWMVQNGVFHVLGDDQTLPGYEPLVFKPSDGTLIGKPARLQDGAIKCATLLRPGLIPARAARIQVQGLGTASYRIRQINSSASNQSGSVVAVTMEVLSTIPGVL